MRGVSNWKCYVTMDLKTGISDGMIHNAKYFHNYLLPTTYYLLKSNPKP